MNRAERRNLERRGANSKQLMDRTLSDRYEAGYKAGMKAVTEIVFYMCAYTINYKLGFGSKRLCEIMKAIYNNIDAYRTGHLSPADYEAIVSDMNKLGINMK